jgi:hypothetical protein
MCNIFILEKEDGGTTLYLFDDGPEIPTVSVWLGGEKEEKLRSGIEGLKRNGVGEQGICEFLFDYFPDYRDHWQNGYGAL